LLEPAELKPLGVRYAVLRRGDDGQYSEASGDETFRSGDRIRLRVEVSETGYLYVIHRGSSGAWKALFPTPDLPGGNLVENGKQYDMPAPHVFLFDDRKGTERLFLVFARQPVQEMAPVLLALGGDEIRETASALSADAARQARGKPSSGINDLVVDKMRDAYSRDLVVEAVDATGAGEQEKAVYSVHPSAGPEGRVVAEITLRHE
jgi:hypothetical protein